MKTKKFFTAALSLALILTAASLGSFAIAMTGDGFSEAGSKNPKPKVVMIKAEWCGACKKLEPMMASLMEEYSGKLDFVVLDVTNDETTAQAAATAKSLGISSFFEANKKMTATVAVFKGKNNVFKATKNFDRADYVAAFNKAIK